MICHVIRRDEKKETLTIPTLFASLRNNQCSVSLYLYRLLLLLYDSIHCFPFFPSILSTLTSLECFVFDRNATQLIQHPPKTEFELESMFSQFSTFTPREFEFCTAITQILEYINMFGVFVSARMILRKVEYEKGMLKRS